MWWDGCRKGDAPSMWIWIAGGLLLGLITMLVLWQLLSSVSETNARLKARSEFVSVTNEVDFLCSSVSIGSQRVLSVELPPAVEGIYAAEEDGDIPEGLAEIMVYQNESNPFPTEGQYVCMKLSGEANPRCQHFNCNVSMDGIAGAPGEGTFYARLHEITGSYTFNYELTLAKEGDRAIRVTARRT